MTGLSKGGPTDLLHPKVNVIPKKDLVMNDPQGCHCIHVFCASIIGQGLSANPSVAYEAQKQMKNK